MNSSEVGSFYSRFKRTVILYRITGYSYYMYTYIQETSQIAFPIAIAI